MNFRTRITIEVINEDDEVVNHRGLPHKPMSKSYELKTTVTFAPTENVNESLKTLNGLFQIIDKVKDFKEQK